MKGNCLQLCNLECKYLIGEKRIGKEQGRCHLVIQLLPINWHNICQPLIFVHNILQRSVFANLIFGDRVDNWIGVLN